MIYTIDKQKLSLSQLQKHFESVPQFLLFEAVDNVCCYFVCFIYVDIHISINVHSSLHFYNYSSLLCRVTNKCQLENINQVIYFHTISFQQFLISSYTFICEKLNIIIQQKATIKMQQSSRKRSRSSTEHKRYQQFINDIYECIRDRDYFKKRYSTTANTMNNFYSILNRNRPINPKLIDKQLDDSKNLNTYIKNCKFKNFLHSDRHQWKKKQNHQKNNRNFHILGLNVKKVNYSTKQKKTIQKKESDHMDSNILVISFRSDSSNHQSKKLFKRSQNTSIKFIKTNSQFCPQPKTQQKSQIFKKKHQQRFMSIIPQYQNTIYQNRIINYKQFIFKMNAIYNIFIDTQKDAINHWNFKSQMKFKAWIGPGNNQHLIKQLIKRRFWWTIVEEKSMNVNFIWTQLKLNEYFDVQPTSHSSSSTASSSLQPLIQKPQSRRKSLRKYSRLQKQEKKSVQQKYLYKIFTQQQIKKYQQLHKKICNKPYLQKKQLLKLSNFHNESSKMHNHLINNFYLGNKKALLYNLKQYYQLVGQNIFQSVPLTFHIKKGFKDHQYAKFLQFYKLRQSHIKKQQQQHNNDCIQKKLRNVWIVKPGQLTNRGNGITVIEKISQLNQIIKKQNTHSDGTDKTFIVQLYIDRPMLYNKRKFDIRHYMLITHIHGLMRGYWYRQGYIRTSSYQFNLNNFQKQIHLTNDAIQKQTQLYGKYQFGNKLSYSQFQKYLDSTFPSKNYNFSQQILPQIKKLSINAIKSSYLKLSPKKLQHNFELFGLDFMIDEDFKLWLIQINTNPCLELSSPLLSRLIPRLVDQTLRLSLDLIFPPPCNYPNTQKHLVPETALQFLNFELIFDEKTDGQQVKALYKKSNDGTLLQDIGNICQQQIFQGEDDGDDDEDFLIDELL